MADEYTLLESSASHKMDPVYSSKQWAYQIDQNQGAYQSKQITFDLSGFFNSARFLNPQEMFIALPVCVAMSAIPAAANAGTGDGMGAQPTPCFQFPGSNMGQVTDQFAFGLKSGHWNLINSIQIQVDGKDVIQMVPNINYHASFVANTTFSEQDVTKHGAVLGFLPDSSDSWKVFASADATGTTGCSRYGFGVTNNSLPPGGSQVTAFPLAQDEDVYINSQVSDVGGINEAHLKRMKQTNQYDPSKHVTAVGGAGLSNNAQSNVLSHAEAAQWASFAERCMEPSLISENMTITGIPAFPANGAQAVPFVCPQAVGNPATANSQDTHSSTSFRELLLTAVIRMKDICNLFSHLPLTRGLYVRMIVMVNTGYVKVPASGSMLSQAIAAVAGVDTLALAVEPSANVPQYVPTRGIHSYESTFTSTCPIMISPLIASFQNRTTATLSTVNNVKTVTYAAESADGEENQAFYPGVARDMGSRNNQGYVLSVAIARPDDIHRQVSGLDAQTAAQLIPHPLQASRMYVPVIDLDPIETSRYLADHKVQSIFYKDVLQYTYPSLGPNQTMNFQLGNGITNAQKLIIIPFYRDSTPIAGTQVPRIPFEPTSPFDSAPATCAPRSCLTNFNVLISNINVFQRNIDYSFENFIEEMSLTNAINGGLDTGLTSGLIDFAKWKDCYRYYVVDLSRRIQGDNTPKSITVLGTNSSQFPVDYYFFVEYRRHLEINVETGHVNVSSN